MRIERVRPAVTVQTRGTPVGAVHVVLALRVVRAQEIERHTFVRYGHIVVLQHEISASDVDHHASTPRQALRLIAPPWLDAGSRSIRVTRKRTPPTRSWFRRRTRGADTASRIGARYDRRRRAGLRALSSIRLPPQHAIDLRWPQHRWTGGTHTLEWLHVSGDSRLYRAWRSYRRPHAHGLLDIDAHRRNFCDVMRLPRHRGRPTVVNARGRHRPRLRRQK